MQCSIAEHLYCSAAAVTVNRIRHGLHKHLPWQQCTGARQRQREEPSPEDIIVALVSWVSAGLVRDVYSHVFLVCPSLCLQVVLFHPPCSNAKPKDCSWSPLCLFVCDNVLWPASVVTVCQRRLKLCPVGYTRPLERFISHNSPRRDTLLTASHGFGSEGEWRSLCLSLFSSKTLDIRCPRK